MSPNLTIADALSLAINVLRDSAESRRMPSGVALNDASASLHLDASETLEQCIADMVVDKRPIGERREKEVAANNAIRTVLGALLRAYELSETAGYGSQVLGPLADAQRETRYALDTAVGRN